MSDCPACDAGIPTRQVMHFRVIDVSSGGQIKHMAIGSKKYSEIADALITARRVRMQQRRATEFKRHMRSIRATQHLVRR